MHIIGIRHNILAQSLVALPLPAGVIYRIYRMPHTLAPYGGDHTVRTQKYGCVNTRSVDHHPRDQVVMPACSDWQSAEGHHTAPRLCAQTNNNKLPELPTSRLQITGRTALSETIEWAKVVSR